MWIAYAMTASLFWGISYTVSEQLMKKISVAGVLLTSAVGCFLFALTVGLTTGVFVKDLEVVKKADGTAKMLMASVLVYVIANTFILLATKSKNATMAAMVEITYPLFTALFAYLIFKELQVNAGVLAGAALVLTGVGCIYYFGKNL